MPDSEIVSGIIIAILGVTGGASAAAIVTAMSRRGVTKAEGDSLVVAAAEKVIQMQELANKRADDERMEVELRLERALERMDRMQHEIDTLRQEQLQERADCAAKIAGLQSQVEQLQYHQENPKEFPHEHLSPAGD